MQPARSDAVARAESSGAEQPMPDMPLAPTATSQNQAVIGDADRLVSESGGEPSHLPPPQHEAAIALASHAAPANLPHPPADVAAISDSGRPPFPPLNFSPHGERRLAQVEVSSPMPEPVSVPYPAAPPGGLTLAALEQMAVGNNPTLAQGQALVGQAQGNWLQVGLYPNPVAGYAANEIGQEGEGGQQGAFVSQTIVRGNKLDLNRAVASWGISRARWQRETQQMRVLNDVRIRFYQTLGAQRLVEIATELEELAEVGVRTARERFEAQLVAQSDVLQAEIQLSEVIILLENARHRELAARQQLANVIGIPQLPHQPLVGSLEDGVEDVDVEVLWQQICAASPLLEAARAEVQRAQTQLQRERVEPVPDLLTQFGTQYDTATDYLVANAQVGVALPIYNRNQGNISAAVAKIRRATANLQRLEFVLRDRLAETYRTYSIARNQVQRYRNDILPKAQRNVQLANEAYRAGEYDFLRVLTARQTLFETEVEYVRSLTDLQQSLVVLDGLLLTGGLADPADDAVNPGGAGGGTQPLTDTPKTE